jgi:hypothetical protein
MVIKSDYYVTKVHNLLWRSVLESCGHNKEPSVPTLGGVFLDQQDINSFSEKIALLEISLIQFRHVMKLDAELTMPKFRPLY